MPFELLGLIVAILLGLFLLLVPLIKVVGRRLRMARAGRVPLAPDYWGAVELTHSLRALTVPMPAADRYAKAYGDSAFAVRRAIEALIDSLAGPQRVESQPEAVGV